MTREEEWGAEFDKHFEEASEASAPTHNRKAARMVFVGIVIAAAIACSIVSVVALLK